MSSRSGFIRATRRSVWSLTLLAPLTLPHAAAAQTAVKPAHQAVVNAAARAAAEAQAVAAPQFVAIVDSVPFGVAHAAKLGPINANQPLSILVCFNYANPQAAQDYANAVSDPNSLLYRQWLTPQEIGQNFGPDPDDYTTMLAHLQAQGLKVEEMPVNRLTLRVSGTAAQVQQAFGVTMNQYREAAADARARRGADAVPYDFYAPSAPTMIPGSLAGKITSVEGLETYTRPIPRSKKVKRLSSNFDAIQARTGYNLTPIYDTLNATATNKPGTGRTIGISNFDGVDVATNGPLFITRNALPFPAAGKASNITTTVVVVGNGTQGGGEGDLDFQAAVGQAPLASIIIYDTKYTAANLISVLAKEVSDNKADVLTESYGWSLTLAQGDSAHTQHTAMTMQGQTYMLASGDNGNLFDDPYQYPDYEPDVTNVGGTILTVGAGNVFTSETGWAGSGGGYCAPLASFNALPAWLKGRGVPTTNKRLLPDISSHAAGAGNAAAYGIYIQGALNGISGTSCSSPVDAGALAVVEQYLITQGALPVVKGKQRLGRINDVLYGFNGRSDVYHDITGTVNNGAGSTTKYWDYVTGWGSVNWNNFAAALIAPLSVSVTPTSASLAAGKTVQLAATVAGSNVKTVTWAIASGPGTVSATGLYTAPFTVTNGQTVVVKATSTIDTANPGVTTVATVQPSPVFGQATITLTAAPDSVTISGIVTLEGISDPAFTNVTTNPVTFVLTPAGGGAATTVMQTLGLGGSFSISSLPAANYTVTIEGDKWLSVKTNANASAGDVTNVAVTLPAGDANGDNSVDPTDFNIFVSAYNSDISIPGSGYNPLADFNNDGIVDPTDFGLFVGNYTKVGQ